MLKNIDLKRIKNTTWYRQGGAGVVFYFYIPFQTAMDIIGAKNIILVQHGPLHHGYFNSALEYKKARAILAKQKIHRGHVDMLIRLWQKNQRRSLTLTAKLTPKVMRRLSNIELLSYYQQLADFDYQIWSTSINIEFFDPWSGKFIGDALRQHGLSIIKPDLDILLSPVELTIAQEQELNLLRSIIKGGKENLARYAAKYFWSANDWAQTRVLTAAYFARMAQPWKKRGRSALVGRVRELAGLPLANAKRVRVLENKYHLPLEVKNILYFFRRAAFWRDQRKQVAQMRNHYWFQFLKEFSRRNKIGVMPLCFAKPPEILASGLSFSPAFKSELKRRVKGCAYLVDSAGKEVVLTGARFRQFDKFLDGVFHAQFKELKGMPAAKGKAQGRVKIVNVSADFAKMKKGDILVAPMTRPEYLPIMKLAAGIITDEGGVTCHAAIVSRELGIPCVIGTQVATQVLHDGDMVEVDANSGVIKKISK
ncbi:MAG: PEP-utilizing enzyme [Candidatus Magasanikbacteria bacterium]